MPRNVDRHAYWAEAGLAHLSDAHILRDGTFQCDRLRCSLYARAARCALNAMLSAQGDQAEVRSLNLLAPVVSLDQAGQGFGRHEERATQYARLLSRVLVIDQSDAGEGYVTRDLFGDQDVEACESAAIFFVDQCCRRLMRATWEQALLRFHPFREPPMVDTRLWARRERSPVRSKRRAS